MQENQNNLPIELRIFLNEEPKNTDFNKIPMMVEELTVALPIIIENSKLLDMLKIKI